MFVVLYATSSGAVSVRACTNRAGTPATVEPADDVLRDDRAGADERARADPHAAEDDGAGADRRPALDDASAAAPSPTPSGAPPELVVARGRLSFTNMTP